MQGPGRMYVDTARRSAGGQHLKKWEAGYHLTMGPSSRDLHSYCIQDSSVVD